LHPLTTKPDIRARTIVGYKPAITTYILRRKEKREKKADYRFVASCNTDSKTFYVYEI
jgi:hypothetical protein